MTAAPPAPPDDDPIPMLTDVLARPPAALTAAERDALVQRVRADVLARLAARTGELVDAPLREALHAELATRMEIMAEALHASLAAMVDALVARAVDEALARLSAAPNDTDPFSHPR